MRDSSYSLAENGSRGIFAVMRRSILVLLAIIPGLSVTAQKKKCYYDAHSLRCNEDSAHSYVVFKETPSGGYNASQYSYWRDELMMTGNYSSISDDLNQGREGTFTFYHISGTKKSEGVYTQNKRNGLWKDYSYEGPLKDETMYLDDSLDGPYTSYFFKTGAKNCVGQHVNGKREGSWKFYFDTSVLEHKYVNGNIQSKMYYTLDGKMLRKLNYERDTLISSQRWDTSGVEIAYVPDKTDSFTNQIYWYIEQMPAFPYDMAKYLRANMVYPRKAQRQKVSGRVVVKFVIDEEGRIDDVHVVNSVSPELDAEAVRVVANMPRWKPGRENGERVRVYFNLPIQFSL